MEGRSLIGPRQRTCRGLAEPRPRPRRAPRRPLAARSHAETIDDTDTEPATALSTRRSVLLGAGALPCGCCGAAAPARASSSSPRRRGFLTAQYDRYMSAALSQDAMAGYERSVAPMKRRLFGGLAGSPNEGLTIVELGVGAAPNARYYCDARRGKNDTIVGVDKNPEVLRRAGAELESRGVDGDRLRLVEADVSSTGLPSGYADAVVGTLLLCSVRDQSEALAEIRRILKPGGKYCFVEHVAAPKGTTLRVAQDILNPLQRAVAGGCNLNRDTAGAIAAAFADGDVTSYRYDVLPGEILFDNGFSLKNEDAPSGLGLLSPHISGEATAGDCVLTRCPPKAKV